MLPKPSHLGPDYGAQFSDSSVVAAYHHRPPYPDEVFDILAGLVVAPGTVLDAGTGTGEIARRLVTRVTAVDAVDPSSGMLARARELPGSDHPALSWILGRAEDAPLHPPYGLIAAAASLHWMDWPVALPRFRELLAPGAVLAIIGLQAQPNPWDRPLQQIIDRYSTNQEFRPYDLLAELQERGLFRQDGRRSTQFTLFRQPLGAYVESFHARNGFSRDRMQPAEAAAFDRAVEELLAPHLVDGQVALTIASDVIWGQPAPGLAL